MVIPVKQGKLAVRNGHEIKVNKSLIDGDSS